jgi:hypothetical protein
MVFPMTAVCPSCRSLLSPEEREQVVREIRKISEATEQMERTLRFSDLGPVLDRLIHRVEDEYNDPSTSSSRRDELSWLDAELDDLRNRWLGLQESSLDRLRVDTEELQKMLERIDEG